MDYEKLAAVEYQIEQKYGVECTRSPRADWTDEDEEEFIRQVDKLYKKLNSAYKEKNYENKTGYLVSKKLLTDENALDNCQVCSLYKIHFNAIDDIKMNQWGCCYRCFIKHIEGREEKWESGWRPESE